MHLRSGDSQSVLRGAAQFLHASGQGLGGETGGKETTGET